jgi:minor extracellular serine protease Vpr
MIKWVAVLTLTLLITSLLPFANNISSYSKVMILSASDINELISTVSSNGIDIKIIDRLSYVTDEGYNAVIAYVQSKHLDMLKSINTLKIIEDKPIRVYSTSTNFNIIGLPNVIDMKDSQGRALTGEGIKIALIDTGVDYTHNDLKGFGPDGKVIDGYDFLEKDNDPLDKDGHGTAVAGIIAADGNMRGIAPKAKLLAYKIASNGNYTSSLDIIRALDMAAKSGANIVNMSIGMDTINYEIDNAVNNLVRRGILVVVAAGNNGQNGMGSPATAKDAITVGALASNVSTVVTTLKVGNSKFEGIPMLGSVIKEGVIQGEIVFVKYAREKDVKDLDLKGKIALAERGGERVMVNGVESMERVYFSEKEKNVASRGAVALVVYNNEPGIFYGTLLHEDNDPDYRPSIPVIALSRDDGLRILDMINNSSNNIRAELRSEHNADTIAVFSSRGPVSPFYIKPNIVAPGVAISSTSLNNSYVTNNGTSFAAPHVSGAAALLMQKYPDLNAQEIASLLITTAKPVKDIYGDIYPFEVAGVGELAIDSALNADLIALPYNLTFYLNAGGNDSKSITLRALNNELKEPEVTVRWINDNEGNKDLLNNKVRVDTQFKRIDGVRGILVVNVSVDKSISVDNVNKYEAILSITHGKTTISVPMVLYINPLAINAISNGNGILTLSLTNGNSNMIDSNGKNGNVSSNGLDDNAIGKWKYASIKIIDPLSMRSRVVTLTPDNNHVNIPLNSGEYWIEATVTTSNNNRMSIFSTVYISNSTTINEQQQLPFKELLIVIGAISIAMVTVLIIGKKREERYMKEIIRNERLNITSSDEKASSMGLGIDDKDKITNSDEDNKTTDS